MLKFLKDALLQSNKGEQDSKKITDPVKLASAALLARAAWLDGKLDAAEEAALNRLMIERFLISETEAQEIISEATKDVDNGNDIYKYTKIVRNSFDNSERVALMEMLWQLVYSDGELHDFEATLMRRLAGLLYVDDRESGAARKRALEKLGVVN